MPAVGLAVPAEHARRRWIRSELLRLVGRRSWSPSSTPARAMMPAWLQDYAELARRLGAELVLEVVLPCVDASGRPTDDLAVLRSDLHYVQGQIDRAACARRGSPVAGLRPEMHPARRRLAQGAGMGELAAAARAAFPGMPIGGGMFSYFTELNRKRPPAGLFDFVGHTICPLVHAGDDLSLTEGLEALPYIMQDCAPSPATRPTGCSPQRSGCARTPTAPPRPRTRMAGRVAMARTDPREHALIGAAWYAGCSPTPRAAAWRRSRSPPSPVRRAWPPRTAAPTRCTRCSRSTPRCAAGRCVPRAATRRAMCRSRPWATRSGWST